MVMCEAVVVVGKWVLRCFYTPLRVSSGSRRVAVICVITRPVLPSTSHPSIRVLLHTQPPSPPTTSTHQQPPRTRSGRPIYSLHRTPYGASAQVARLAGREGGRKPGSPNNHRRKQRCDRGQAIRGLDVVDGGPAIQ